MPAPEGQSPPGRDEFQEAAVDAAREIIDDVPEDLKTTDHQAAAPPWPGDLPQREAPPESPWKADLGPSTVRSGLDIPIGRRLQAEDKVPIKGNETSDSQAGLHQTDNTNAEAEPPNTPPVSMGDAIAATADMKRNPAGLTVGNNPRTRVILGGPNKLPIIPRDVQSPDASSPPPTEGLIDGVPPNLK